MAQRFYIAKITPAAGGSPIEVTVPANDITQAKKIIEGQYGPVRSWWRYPQPVR